MNRRHRTVGFTLIELLIIIVIIGILAAIVIPNFLERSHRSPVSRLKSDQRILATAIEAYYVDNSEYPAWSTDPAQSAHGMVNPKKATDKHPLNTPTFRMRHNTDLQTLTTPVAYISSFFSDPFTKPKGRTFNYFTHTSGEKKGWILYSPGPDGDIDIQLEDYDVSIPQPSKRLLLVSYDSTNGTVSGGDVWRVMQ